ncbi:MAG: aldehyde dehydrogenase family protein [Acidimicrobiales bacterium]
MPDETTHTIGAGPYRQLIGGEWVDGGKGTYKIINPATEEVVGEAPEASVDDIEAATAAAKAAQPGWAALGPDKRSALLQRVAGELKARSRDFVDLVIAETGATKMVGSTMQVPQAGARFEYYAKAALAPIDVPLPPQPMPNTALAPGGLIGAVVHRAPVGVVAAITSYNFPAVNMAGKLAPALAAGNAVVVKPAPQDPLACIEILKICNDVGIPEGVVNIVTGSGAEAGAALVASPNVDMVSFTGSSNVGVAIQTECAKSFKRTLMELGGKGACIVREDADVKAAVTGLASVWGFHSGQICTAPTRAIVHRSRYDEIVAALTGASARMTVGDPREKTTVVGPVISEAHRARVEAQLQQGLDQGAEVLVGGKRPDIERGYYVAPTLVATDNQNVAAREEFFAPIIVVIPFDDDEEGIAIANDSPYGLYDYVYTDDMAKGYAIAKRLEAGNVGINTAQRNHEAPFGGFKMSGIGRDGGMFGVHAYTEMQSIVWPS